MRLRRNENVGSKILSTIYAIGGAVALYLGDEITMVICLSGFLYEEQKRQIATLRREIRAKKMWHGGD